MSEEPEVRQGEVDAAVAAELPGLWLAWSELEAVPGPSPPELRRRLRTLSDEFRGPQAIALRQQPIPQAYRIFFRHIGLEPDERRTPVEALALERMKRGGFRSRSLVDDALTVAVMETSVPVWALDGERLDGPPRVRSEDGRLVVADAAGPVAELFGDALPGRGVTRESRRIVLYSVAVAGVPPIHVEEALWIAWDIIAGE